MSAVSELEAPAAPQPEQTDDAALQQAGLPEQPQQGEEATSDDPSESTPEQLSDEVTLTEDEQKAVLALIQRYQASWLNPRRELFRRIMKAFAMFKNNPYGIWNSETGDFDSITAMLSDLNTPGEKRLYLYNDNVYQMLGLSLIAAMSNNSDRIRYAPDDPENEEDLLIVKKASLMAAYIERKNDIDTIQKLEWLYLWCCGSYFSYTRNIVDSARAGISRDPVFELQMATVRPDRFLCNNCGGETAVQHAGDLNAPTCANPKCGQPVSEANFYPEEQMPVPQRVGWSESANSMTAMDVYSPLNVDCDPDCLDPIRESPLLALEGEMYAAAVRAAYPGFYTQIQGGAYSSQSSGDDQARQDRGRKTSPSATFSATADDMKGTFSRVWLEPWAFNTIDDQEVARALVAKMPKGGKFVIWGGTLILEVRQEAKSTCWTWCGTVRGTGTFPGGIGDTALDVQARVDNTANNTEAYMDSLATPTVIVDADVFSSSLLDRPMGNNRFIYAKRAEDGIGNSRSLSDSVFQPTFRADSALYQYHPGLVQLMQLLSGVQPQVFGGGTTTGVDTASGQKQMLNTAMGRLMLFLTQARAEHARRIELAVKNMARNIDDRYRLVVEGDVEGEWKNEYILQSEVQGEFHAYPEPDQGFPESFSDMRDRIMELLGMVQKNPVLMSLLGEPDTQKTIATYILPNGVKLPGDGSRHKIKLTLMKLAQGQPEVMPPQQPGAPPVVIPSVKPDPDFDDMGMIVQLTKEYAEENYTLADTNPAGYANLRAYLRLASQLQATTQAKQAVMAAAAQGGGPGAGGPPPGAGPGAAQ